MDYYVQITSKTALKTALETVGFDMAAFLDGQTVNIRYQKPDTEIVYEAVVDWVGKVPKTFNADGTVATYWTGQYALVRALNDATDALFTDPKFTKRVFPADQVPRVFL